MSLKLDCKIILFVVLIAFLLYGAIVARIVLASHHKGQIAFTSTRDGNHEIYVVDPRWQSPGTVNTPSGGRRRTLMVARWAQNRICF